MRGRKTQVELVEGGRGALEDHGAADVELDPQDAGPEPRESGWRRIRRAWPLAVVAVVVAGAYLVTGARERAALAARHALLQDQLAYVPDLGRAPEPLWRVETRSEPWSSPAVSGGAVVVSGGSPDGEPVSVALDLETGTALWEIESSPGESVFCGLPREVLASPDGTVVCLAQRGESDEEPFSVASLEHRDPRTGQVRTELAWPADNRF